MIKLLIIDDHPLVTDGIRTMLKDVAYLEIAGTARTAKAAIAFLRDCPPIDVILMDINLPDMDGIRLCELIRDTHKEVKILGLTYINEAAIITQLIKKGANGYLIKDMEREELIHAIDQVMDGTLYLSKAANEKVLRQLREHDIPGKTIPVITRREKEILQLLYKGHTSQEIAGQLYLSVYTVDTHRRNLLQKFNVHNTQALLHVTREMGLLDA
ncbi:MAG TPA: response regulator transcription factor [Puia sp.]|nr:response regulator transcription factor [Puia sp.]